MEVYKAIAEIIGEMSVEGISKGSKNQQQGFMFRGIDAVYNALAPKLAKHKLMILPRVLSRQVTEKQTQRGGTLFYVVCECEFDFVSAIDGSKHTVKVFGEAMDSGDKATNKAMSIALKYAAFQTFFIPTEATTQDPDATCHDVVSLISGAQVDQIKSAIESKGYTVDGALGVFGLADLSEIQTNSFNSFMNSVNNWEKAN